ncbi:GTP cyclohydrolase folE2 [Neisseria meningitidis NM151]|nr:GTP cyclohydrolase folE2 [Neisseria meningitidis NM151]
MNTIADVQSSRDLRNLPINQVGIKDLRFPITLQTAEGIQSTVARLTMTVYLPAEQKGTHMSRFVALMEQHTEALDFAQLRRLTAVADLLDYDVSLTGEIKDGAYGHSMKVMIPVTSLCPCSKEISQYGAHNQRSHVTVSLTADAEVGIEEVIDYVEAQASCQLYGLLKRPDEKYVTEKAYENPKFVEDMVRDVATSLIADKRIKSFVVESENFESIHNHSAYAYIAYP